MRIHTNNNNNNLIHNLPQRSHLKPSYPSS